MLKINNMTSEKQIQIWVRNFNSRLGGMSTVEIDVQETVCNRAQMGNGPVKPCSSHACCHGNLHRVLFSSLAANQGEAGWRGRNRAPSFVTGASVCCCCCSIKSWHRPSWLIQGYIHIWHNSFWDKQIIIILLMSLKFFFCIFMEHS